MLTPLLTFCFHAHRFCLRAYVVLRGAYAELTRSLRWLTRTTVLLTLHPCKGPPCLTWTQGFRTWLPWSNQETMVYTYIYILIYIYSYIIHIISNIMEWYPIWSIFRSNLPQAPQPQRLGRLGTIQRPASRQVAAGGDVLRSLTILP